MTDRVQWEGEDRDGDRQGTVGGGDRDGDRQGTVGGGGQGW